MKKINFFLLVLFVLVFIPSCSSDDDDLPVIPTYDYLIKANKAFNEPIQAAALQFFLNTQPDYQVYASLPEANVNLYQVSYCTQYQGNPVTASGVFVVPEGYDYNMPTVVYTHGTIYKNEAPSLNLSLAGFQNSIEVFLCAVLSSSFNCAVLMPDYIGYGDSQSITHPYTHAESLGQASLDLIRAYKEYAGTSFNNHLLLTGYSEGGFAAVALQKKIQEMPQAGLQIDKTIAGSGAYDNVALAQKFLAKDDDTSLHFVSSYLWVFQMYKTDYGYSKSYDDIFSPEDNTTLKAHNYDMAYFAPENLSINSTPTQLFTSDFRNGVVNGTDTEFMQILTDNSLTEFAPADSLLFVCGSADDWVYPENTRNAYDKMRSKGCKVWMYEETGGDHYSTLPVFLDILLKRMNLYK